MASIKKRGSSWQVRYSYKDTEGKYRIKSKAGFRTKKEAEIFASEIKVDDSKGINLSPDGISLADYFEQWYETYKKPKLAYTTRQRYKITQHVLNDYFKGMPLIEVKRFAYQKFITDYGKTHAKETVQKVNSLVRACVQNALLDELITKDFTKGITLSYNVDKDKKVDYLNMAEIKSVVNYLLETRNHHFTSKYMILTAIMTGARLGEIMALTWKDINFDFKTINIAKAWNYSEGGGFKPVKTESSKRTIRVNDLLLNVLKDLKVNDSKMVFMDQYKTIPSSAAVNKTLKAVLSQLGIKRPGFHFHSLRHSHVAYLLANHVDLYVISKRLGHSDIGTTSRVYSYLIDEYKARFDDRIEKSLDGLFPPIPIRKKTALKK